MAVFTSRMLTTPRGRFHLREAGPRDARPLLLLHGWPESGYCWAGVAQSLHDHFHLIVPDLRGLGDSERTLDVSAYAKRARACCQFMRARADDPWAARRGAASAV